MQRLAGCETLTQNRLKIRDSVFSKAQFDILCF